MKINVDNKGRTVEGIYDIKETVMSDRESLDQYQTYISFNKRTRLSSPRKMSALFVYSNA